MIGSAGPSKDRAPATIRHAVLALVAAFDLRGATTSAAAFLLLAALVPIVFCTAVLNQAGTSRWSSAALLYLFVMLYSGTRLAAYCHGGPPKYLGIAFFGFTYVWLGLAAFAQTVSQVWPLRYSFTDDIQAQAALVVVVGTLSYDVGRLMRSRLRRVNRVHRETTRRLSLRRVLLLSCSVIVLSPLAITLLGGLGVLFSNRQTADNALYPSGIANGVAQSQLDILPGTLLKDAVGVLAFVALYSLWILIREDRDATARSRRWHFVLLGSLVIVNVIVNNPLSTGRQWFGTIVVASALAIPLVRGAISKTAFVICMLIGTSALFSLGNAFRGPSTVATGEAAGVIRNLQTSPDYDAAAEVAATANYVSLVGNTDGGELVGAVLFWVPRRIWPDKSIGTGYLLGYFFGTATPNLSAPLWAEGYIDFGWPGVILFLMAAGYLSEALDRSWSEKTASGLVGVMVPLLAGYSFILLRGPLLPAMPRLAVFVIAVWLLCAPIRSQMPAEDLDRAHSRTTELLSES